MIATSGEGGSVGSGGGDWLLVGAVAKRLHVSPDQVRWYADAGYLRSIRPPSMGPGHTARRIDPASVDELLAVMRIADAAQRHVAMEELRARNRA